jgi:hypothetical protein
VSSCHYSQQITIYLLLIFTAIKRNVAAHQTRIASSLPKEMKVLTASQDCGAAIFKDPLAKLEV